MIAFRAVQPAADLVGDVDRSTVDSATGRATGRVCGGCARTPQEPQIKLVNDDAFANDTKTILWQVAFLRNVVAERYSRRCGSQRCYWAGLYQPFAPRGIGLCMMVPCGAGRRPEKVPRP